MKKKKNKVNSVQKKRENDFYNTHGEARNQLVVVKGRT